MERLSRFWLALQGFWLELSWPANPHDNARWESFIKTLKREEIYANEYENLEHLRSDLVEFIERHYNKRRLRSVLGYRSLEEFEEQVGHDVGNGGLCVNPGSAHLDQCRNAEKMRIFSGFGVVTLATPSHVL